MLTASSSNLSSSGIAVATAIARRSRLRRYLGSRKQVLVENRILITADPLRVRDLEVTAPQFIKQRVCFRRLNLHRNADILQIVLNHSRILSPGDTTSGNFVDHRFRKTHSWSITVGIPKARFVEKLLRPGRIERIGLPGV